MDLSALLAREGIEANELDALVDWARQRAGVLISRIESGSALAEALGSVLEHARDANGAPLARPATRSAPSPVARAVSKPYLGAAVAAALSGKHEDLDLALETAAAQADEREPELAVVPEPEPEPAPAVEAEPDDNDPLIGGFSRFAFSFRRRAAEKAAAEEDQAHRSRVAAQVQAQVETSATDPWRADARELPEPPTFEAKRSIRRYHPGVDPNDAEASGLLVLGIPDEEGIDIPVLRPRPRSAGLRSSEPSQPHVAISADVSRPHEVAQPQYESAEHPMRPVLDDDDSFDLGLDNLEADPTAPEHPASDFDHADADPHAAGHAVSGPQRMDSGPVDDDDEDDEAGPQARNSGPVDDDDEDSQHFDGRPSSGPSAHGSGPHGPPPPPPARGSSASTRGLPPPLPREGGRGRGKPPPTPGSAAKATQAKGSKRKKVLDLSQPVARPVSAPQPAAPSERSGRRPIPADDEVLASPRRPAVPDYMRDDDE